MPVIDPQVIIQEAFDKTNQIRAEAGKPKLEKAPTLVQEYANVRAKELAQLFSHRRPNGESTWTELDVANDEGKIDCLFSSENILWTESIKTDGADLVQLFDISPGHWENMLKERHDALAIGYYMSADHRTQYLVQIFTKDIDN